MIKLDVQKLAEDHNKKVVIIFYVDQFNCGFVSYGINPLVDKMAREYAEKEIKVIEKDLKG